MISLKNKENLIVANALIGEGKPTTAGLVGVAIFESIIEELETQLKGEVLRNNYRIRIDNLVDQELIDNNIEKGLERAWKERNHIIHPSLKKCPCPIYCLNSYPSCCKSIVRTLAETFSVVLKNDYEKKATAEQALHPDAWTDIKIHHQERPVLEEKHFANLKYAEKYYMRPLGSYLAFKYLKKIDPSLVFQPLSRVDYSSGYIWLSAVKESTNSDGSYRPRVALPGLTIVFKPTGINVYVELPGKCINYKKSYYGKLLDYSSLTNLLKKSPKLNDDKYEFFHTWWFADREYVGSVKEYLSCKKQSLTAIRDGWKFKELQDDRLEEIQKAEESAEDFTEITRNSFLIGRFYKRQDCLEYGKELPDMIANDFQVLYPILNALYKTVKI